jgi:signal transduction histidine kinase
MTSNEILLSMLLAVSLLIACFQFWKISTLMKSIKVAKAQRSDDDFSTLSTHIENERSRISSDLHDELGTLVTLIHLDLEMVIKEASALTPEGEHRLGEIKRNLELMMKSIRSSIWKLSAQMFDEVDLASTIRELCRKWDQHKGAHVLFVQTGIPFEVAEEFKLHLFRITQELLNNAIRHSSALNISAHLHWGDNQTMSITVEDDGIGYLSRKVTAGIGMLSITKRAAHINASINKEPLKKGQRITISLQVP